MLYKHLQNISSSIYSSHQVFEVAWLKNRADENAPSFQKAIKAAL
jgi:hypothetical protein